MQKGKQIRSTSGLQLAFLVTVAIKGIDGLIETAAGVLIAVAGPWRLYTFIIRITAPELDFRPVSKVAHAVRHGAADLAQSSGHFVVIWLLGMA